MLASLDLGPGQFQAILGRLAVLFQGKRIAKDIDEADAGRDHLEIGRQPGGPSDLKVGTVNVGVRNSASGEAVRAIAKDLDVLAAQELTHGGPAAKQLNKMFKYRFPVSTVGLWLESFWIDAVYHYPWPSSIWPEALMMAVPVAVLTGACGAMLGMVLTDQRLPSRAIGIGLVALTVLVIGGATANGLRYEVPQNATATMTLTEAPGSAPDKRMVTADVRINPPDLISEDPSWVSVLGWQGGLANERGIFVDRLERLGPGHYRSTQPMPVYGQWKTLLRVHDGKTFTAAPIYLAADPGINVPEVPAQPSMTRPFVSEITILQRERSPDTPEVLWTGGCVIVLVCTLIMIGGLTWGAGRINRREPTDSKTELQPSAQA